MHPRAFLAGACAAAMACAPALAQTQTNLDVRDAAGAVTATCAWSSGGAVFPCHLDYGMDGAGALHPVLTDSSGHPLVSFSGAINVQGGNSVAVKTDGSGVTQPISAASLPLPTGASTAANQTAVQAAPGVSASTAVGVQGVSGGLAVPVTGTFWQATQPVSAAALPLPSGAATSANQPALNGDGGALAHVTNLPATQAVTGTFWQSTQPVSVAALPLPSGAATAANQTAVEAAAGSASSSALGVQGVTGGLAVKTDGSAVTQPVSAASLPLPSGAATAAKQPALGAAGSPSSDVITVQGAPSMTALKVDGSGVTQPVSGTFWQATQPVSGTVQASNLPATVDTNSGNKSASTLRVVLATDQPQLSNKLLVTPDLPSGASTAANQTAVQAVAGSSSSSAVGVQGVAGGVPIVTQFGHTAIVQSTSTLTAGTYANNQSLGPLVTLDLSPYVGAASKQVRIERLSILFTAGSIATANPSASVFFFNATPTTTFTDNSTVTWNTSDNTKIDGLITPFTASFQLGSNVAEYASASGAAPLGLIVNTDTSGHLPIAFLNQNGTVYTGSPVMVVTYQVSYGTP
jgi:hypothetical protein